MSAAARISKLGLLKMCATMVVSLIVALLEAPSALAQSSYKLQPGDAIEIWMAQYSDLTRQVTLAPDGWISLPLAGAMQAQGMTIENLQIALVERLQPFFNDDVGLNVSLVPSERNQPSIFVAGDVETPGLYQYRPGMTVLHAISVAGGIYRPTMTPADQDRSMEIENLLANGEKRLSELNIIIARLNAQIAGETEFTIPSGVEAADVASFVSRERALLAMQSNSVRSQQDALLRMTAINEDSIAAVKDQISSVEQRIGLAKERMSATATLVERGVVQASSVREIEVNIVEMEGSLSQLRTTLAMQRAAILTEQNRVDLLTQDFQLGLTTQLSAVEREREELREEMANYHETMELYEPAATAGQSRLRYEIIRPTEGASLDVDATEQTMILPGDLIRVSRSTLMPQPILPVLEAPSAPEAISGTSPVASSEPS
ncbi:polysaccharide biosynthesis/export family protein [Devosia submarina]|uniref:polysaccharide biosynthesis/export family protein n=1 Tax=Devosia submarina TaxID=1173082 RepID=UPI000D363BE5|nr:polysaccharide biosynthesis/export family protein [Devosia submarina]